jgi:hypothetical protein
LFPRRGEWRVDWRYLGDAPFSSRPFFDDVVTAALWNPFPAAFWRDTPVQTMLDWAERIPAVPVRGIVHHMSRCGSTLVNRMLAACPANIALSEPSPLDIILRARLPREERIRWARAWVTACARPRTGERAIFIKADCWHFRETSFFQEAFPEARWIFLYREPLEVVVSHVQEPSPWTARGMMDPALLGLSQQEALALTQEDYLGKALGVILEWARERADDPQGLFVNYRELPDAFRERILPHLGVEYSASDVELMEAAAKRNAKEPSVDFQPDVERKQKAVKPWMREVAERWISPHYRALEEMKAYCQ